MTWTYSNPAENDRDAVRYLVGDTDTTDQLVSDEEIAYLLAEEGNVYEAAAATAEAIAAKFARTINQSGDGLSWNGSELFKHYRELAKSLHGLAKVKTRAGTKPYAGGIFKHDRVMDDSNSSLERGYFRSRMHDNPNYSGSSPDPLKSDQ